MLNSCVCLQIIYVLYIVQRDDVLLSVQHGMDADFLWRLSRATYYQSKSEALRDKNRQQKLVYQALEYAGRALKLDDNNPNVHKWFV